MTDLNNRGNFIIASIIFYYSMMRILDFLFCFVQQNKINTHTHNLKRFLKGLFFSKILKWRNFILELDRTITRIEQKKP